VTPLEAHLSVRLVIDDGPIFPALMVDAGRPPATMKVEEIVYEANLLTGEEHVSAYGRATTNSRLAQAPLGAGRLVQVPEDQLAAWLVEARQIAAALPAVPPSQ
jgi:hypothetical protein